MGTKVSSGTRVSVSYSQILTSRDGVIAPSYTISAPVDDLLRLARSSSEDDNGFRARVEERYGTAAIDALRGDHLVASARAIERACSALDERRLELPSALARALRDVTFIDDRSATIPENNLLALATWALIMIIQRERVRLTTCPSCNTPWLAPLDGSVFCARPAPGHTRSCHDVQKEKELHERPEYAAYRREYKRIAAAARRGSIDRDDVNTWRTDNNSHAWKTFDDWKNVKQRRPHRTTKKEVRQQSPAD
jgi:hypothetical protein